MNLIKVIIEFQFSSAITFTVQCLTYRTRVPAANPEHKNKRSSAQSTQPKTKEELLKSLWEEYEQIYFHGINPNDFTRLDYIYYALLAKTRSLISPSRGSQTSVCRCPGLLRSLLLVSHPPTPADKFQQTRPRRPLHANTAAALLYYSENLLRFALAAEA